MDARAVRAVLVDPGPEVLEQAYALRHKVFVEEQGVPVALERDADDAAARHVVVLEGGAAVATGRMLLRGGRGKMQRIAVARERRRAGLGAVIMGALEAAAREGGAAEAVLSSQVDAQPFYERLGYAAEGERYLEAGIWHVTMRKPLR